jgi:hypothetical protein
MGKAVRKACCGRGLTSDRRHLLLRAGIHLDHGKSLLKTVVKSASAIVLMDLLLL